MRFVTLVSIVAIGAGAQLGCASANNDFAAPRVTAQNLVALPSAGGQQRFRVSILIDNPNPEPLLVRDLEFKLRLANEGILDGRSTEPFTVAALDRHTLALELRSDIISSASRLLSFVQGPENALPYELFGQLILDRALKEPLTLNARGLVPLAISDE